MEITREGAAKVLAAVDSGLVKGVGSAKPGRLCVEAAVCYGLGLPHSDNPTCVSPALRALKNPSQRRPMVVECGAYGWVA